MAPPSKLAVSTSVVLRLVKEEASYHKELTQQEARIAKLEAGSEGENAEFQLKQERQALQETKNVIPEVREKIKKALVQLEDQLEASGETSTEEITKAKDMMAKAKATLEEAV
ncbi:tubulin binding cofactor A [Amniculicola lignicola CBS 123094]|uniref:Tubulin-specific chaperone A n=1 Tax=Amniculicola lignicola CBS 123094 TaxID=1392246 RepID=A0A6A5WFC3_9PLEO|nr:tubulin binding cofactor A [Amniculicola lignicola CBS 123094]